MDTSEFLTVYTLVDGMVANIDVLGVGGGRGVGP